MEPQDEDTFKKFWHKIKGRYLRKSKISYNDVRAYEKLSIK